MKAPPSERAVSCDSAMPGRGRKSAATKASAPRAEPIVQESCAELRHGVRDREGARHEPELHGRRAECQSIERKEREHHRDPETRDECHAREDGERRWERAQCREAADHERERIFSSCTCAGSIWYPSLALIPRIVLFGSSFVVSIARNPFAFARDRASTFIAVASPRPRYSRAVPVIQVYPSRD